jgi:hypothetical protein
MTSQRGTSGEYEEEILIQNSSPDLLEKARCGRRFARWILNVPGAETATSLRLCCTSRGICSRRLSHGPEAA